MIHVEMPNAHLTHDPLDESGLSSRPAVPEVKHWVSYISRIPSCENNFIPAPEFTNLESSPLSGLARTMMSLSIDFCCEHTVSAFMKVFCSLALSPCLYGFGISMSLSGLHESGRIQK